MFANNRAIAAYDRHPDDDTVYESQVQGTVWTEPFTQGYNNYDISYVRGEAFAFYTVIFDTVGGEPVPLLQSVISGECAIKPLVEPQKTGYAFNGWFTHISGGVEWDFDAPIAEDVTLYAQWTDTTIKTYNIYYDLRGGINAPGNPTKYVTNKLPLAIAAPSREGFVFRNWVAIYADGTVNTLPTNGIPTGTTGDITLVAIWNTPTDEHYNIHYNLHGGTNAAGNPTTYS